MNFSEDRISHLSHLILDELEKLGTFEDSGKSAVLHDIKKILSNFCDAGDQVDTFVRQKIRSYSRPVPEGSREWDVLYDKFFEEEMRKRGLSE